jgi:hypothetical protein
MSYCGWIAIGVAAIVAVAGNGVLLSGVPTDTQRLAVCFDSAAAFDDACVSDDTIEYERFDGNGLTFVLVGNIVLGLIAAVYSMVSCAVARRQVATSYAAPMQRPDDDAAHAGIAREPSYPVAQTASVPGTSTPPRKVVARRPIDPPNVA